MAIPSGATAPPVSAGPPSWRALPVKTHHVMPGQIFASSEPTAVTTIVGSCVAICLWDATTGVGGMNHYVLPECPSPRMASARFADIACQRLLERLMELGASGRALQARVVGGACLISAFRERGTHLGAQNVDAGLALLRAGGIRITELETGGNRGRKVVFRTHDGAIAIQPL
ncbi:chemotaxis protein CheD [Sorangium sp. So ce1335]|uniref:chemotaxis protein CheD n=1 Tax=Sorangium sp. So ce1335 TaxID=3133335 RepID=UPI003F636070